MTRYLINNLHIIDPRRVGVWGWSYGGYVTLAALSEPKQDIFQCGVSVAPVTNWRYYGKGQFITGITFQEGREGGQAKSKNCSNDDDISQYQNLGWGGVGHV